MAKIEGQSNRIHKLKRLYNIHCLAAIVLSFFLLYLSIRGIWDTPFSFRTSLIIGLLSAALFFALTLYPNELYKSRRLWQKKSFSI